jgi:hypothetical protein
LESKRRDLIRPGTEFFGHAISSQNAQVMTAVNSAPLCHRPKSLKLPVASPFDRVTEANTLQTLRFICYVSVK